MQMNAGKLNVHLYDALRKSLYKPSAFFLGILFPLCEVCSVSFISDDANVVERVFIERSCYRCIGALEGVGANASFRRCFSKARSDGLLWYVPALRSIPNRELTPRSQLPLHPYPPRQEIRPSLQDRRRPRLPLHQTREFPTQ